MTQPTFDWNANPEHLAARAAELALEQHDRLDRYLTRRPNEGAVFYTQRFEVGISNQIASLMCAYAVLKGYVTPERARVTTPKP